MKKQLRTKMRGLGRVFGRPASESVEPVESVESVELVEPTQQAPVGAAETAEAAEAADSEGAALAALSPASASADDVAQTVVRAPLDGQIIALSEVEDPVFAQAMIGPGVAIRPTSTTVHSPVSGTVMLVFPTGHAVAVRADSGAEVLVHVGIDTVMLKGQGFETLVAKGDVVEAGAPLLRFDPATVEAAGYSLTTPVIVTNFKRFGAPSAVADDQVSTGDHLYLVDPL